MKVLMIVFFLLTSSLTISFCIVTRKGLPVLNRFYTRKATTIQEKECICVSNDLCSCCEFVSVLDNHSKKSLCLNLNHEKNFLGVNVSIDSTVLTFVILNGSKNVKLCSAIPEDIFSKTCVEINNKFSPGYVTVCSKMNFLSRYENLQTKFNCVNVTTKLFENIQNGLMHKVPQYPIPQYAEHYIYTQIDKPTTGLSSIDQIVKGHISNSSLSHISLNISSLNASIAIITNHPNFTDQRVNKSLHASFPQIVSISKQNQTSKDSPILIRLSNLANIKEIKRFSEVTMSSAMQHNNFTISNHKLMDNVKKKQNKNNDKKIRFPDSSNVRRSKYKPLSPAIVNASPLQDFNLQFFPSILLSNNNNYPISPPLFNYFPKVNAVFPFNNPSDIAVRNVTVLNYDKDYHFPSRIPPAIQEYQKEVEELITPTPQIFLNPRSKLIAIN